MIIGRAWNSRSAKGMAGLQGERGAGEHGYCQFRHMELGRMQGEHRAWSGMQGEHKGKVWWW